MQLGSCCIGPPARQPADTTNIASPPPAQRELEWGERFAVQESRSVAEHDAARTRSASMKDRKTDYGTVILHWLNFLDAILPRENVWVPHMQAALVLVALTLTYVVYLFRSGLTARVRLDQIRLRGLLANGQARLRA